MAAPEVLNIHTNIRSIRVVQEIIKKAKNLRRLKRLPAGLSDTTRLLRNIFT